MTLMLLKLKPILVIYIFFVFRYKTDFETLEYFLLLPIQAICMGKRLEYTFKIW